MKFLANENFPKSSIEILTRAGYDIIGVGIDFHGIEDHEVIQLAIDENRTIITFDRDYGELIFKKGLKPKAGVIYMRWESFSPEEPGEYLKVFLHSSKIKISQMLTVIGENSIRQRRY